MKTCQGHFRGIMIPLRGSEYTNNSIHILVQPLYLSFIFNMEWKFLLTVVFSLVYIELINDLLLFT